MICWQASLRLQGAQIGYFKDLDDGLDACLFTRRLEKGRRSTIGGQHRRGAR